MGWWQAGTTTTRELDGERDGEGDRDGPPLSRIAVREQSSSHEQSIATRDAGVAMGSLTWVVATRHTRRPRENYNEMEKETKTERETDRH